MEDASIDRETFEQMMEALDKDGDGTVTKDEFKIPCAMARYIPQKQARGCLLWPWLPLKRERRRARARYSSPTRASDAGG